MIHKELAQQSLIGFERSDFGDEAISADTSGP